MKNTVISIITFVAFIVLLVSATMLDSDSVIPFIISITSGFWIVLFAVANKDFDFDKKS